MEREIQSSTAFVGSQLCLGSGVHLFPPGLSSTSFFYCGLSCKGFSRNFKLQARSQCTKSLSRLLGRKGCIVSSLYNNLAPNLRVDIFLVDDALQLMVMPQASNILALAFFFLETFLNGYEGHTLLKEIINEKYEDQLTLKALPFNHISSDNFYLDWVFLGKDLICVF